MFINIIYVLIASILIFVLYLAVKAITRGVEAKGDLKQEEIIEKDDLSKIENNVTDELQKIQKMHEDGILDEEEFKKAKEKILK
tara:strand:+ start:384 stop:635 length:252 start_codon:yes stop_codon:yes gene_type:complete